MSFRGLIVQLRGYQSEAIASVYRWLGENQGNPVIVLPTGAGKTPVIATLCRDVAGWGGRVLVLAHVKELLEQSANTLRVIDPSLRVGVYSAGLGKRDMAQPIIVAGVQSVYAKMFDFEPWDLILIDECHLLPPEGEGRYRTLIADALTANPKCRIIGLTATPYRTSSGDLCGPEEIFSEVCYEIGVKELIVNGFLCPLTSKASVTEFDLSAVKIRGGEFVESEMQAAMGENEELVRAACVEMVAASQDRKACLVFASGVNHAWQIERILRGMGESCEVVTGETDSADRREVLDEFRGGSLKWLVNVNVLTTGFDARHIDMIAILRATMSPGLWYQMCGRGLRIHESKRNCLVLDFGGNASRHGPIDQIKRKTKRPGDSEAPSKTCPDCREVVAAGCVVCPECGHEFEREEKPRHEANAGKSGVISGEITDTVHDVKRELFGVHHKRGADEDAPKTMRVEYEVGFHQFVSEWICIEHSGFARSKAYKWWKERTDLPFPASAADAVTIAKQGLLRPAKQITVREISGQKFSSVIEHVLDADWVAPVAKKDKCAYCGGDYHITDEMCSYCGCSPPMSSSEVSAKNLRFCRECDRYVTHRWRDDCENTCDNCSSTTTATKSELDELDEIQEPKSGRVCRECGACDFEFGPGAGPHAARESCANCGAFVRWVSKSEAGELSPVGYDSLDEIPF